MKHTAWTSSIFDTELHDTACDVLHGGIIEHERRWQLDTELLLQAVSERDCCETVHSAVHERAVQENLFVEADCRLRHLLDGRRHILIAQALVCLHNSAGRRCCS